MEYKNKTCCVFGHRKIQDKDLIREKLLHIFKELILSYEVDTFLLGSKSEFDDLCSKMLKSLKKEYPHIRRVYVRSMYPVLDEEYEQWLLEHFDETYFPPGAEKAGRARYVERNYNMIDNSDICVIYYNENYLPPRRKQGKRYLSDYQPKSGTAVAYKYAVKKNKIIINTFSDTKI